jgi:hypothetical protein
MQLFWTLELLSLMPARARWRPPTMSCEERVRAATWEPPQPCAQHEQLAHVLAREVQPERAAHRLAFAPRARSIVCLDRDVPAGVMAKEIKDER